MHSLPHCILTFDLLCHPQPAGRFQHPGLITVQQEEGVVVAEGCGIFSTLPPLAMLLQEARDDCHCPPSTVASLQPQSDEDTQVTPSVSLHLKKLFVDQLYMYVYISFTPTALFTFMFLIV